jgi:hypothetical protein
MKFMASFLVAAAMATVPVYAEDLAPVELNSLPAASGRIAAAPVFDQHGKLIGHVRKPVAISYVAENTGKLIIVSAAAIGYVG